MIKLRQNHKFLTVTYSIKQICQPLEILKIHGFSFYRKYHDDRELYLSNDVQWVKDYYGLGLYTSSIYHNQSTEYSSGFTIWPEENGGSIFSHARDYFGRDYGFTYISQAKNYTDYFFFSVNRKNKNMMQFYINNLDLFENFVGYFKEQAAEIINQCMQSTIILPSRLTCDAFQIWSEKASMQKNIRELFVQKITKTQQDIILKINARAIAQLSAKEQTVLSFLSAQTTAADIAAKMYLSERTVETHLDNIKRKLNCKSKIELLLLLESI